MSNNPFPPPQTLTAVTPLQPPPYVDDSPPQTSSAASAVIIVIVIGSAFIISDAIYLFLRFINNRFRRPSVASRDSTTLNSNRPQCHVAPSGLFDSLPVFTFRSVTGNIGGGDCAVCLSKFEAEDQLRLLPLCCHAFHADCIDAWIVVNQTCPLCRSAVVSCDADKLGKIGANSLNRGGSFRIEIGSISRRGGGGLAAPVVEGAAPRSYSIGGSFDYVVDDNGYEIPVGSTTHRTGISGGFSSIDKESSVAIPMPEPPGEVLAADVSGGRNWLLEYVDRLASVSISSRAMSFRSSGRFFSGSSRRNDHGAAAMADLEAYSVGEEISELFRWFSGV